MTITNNIVTLEKSRFFEDTNGNVAVRVGLTSNGSVSDVNSTSTPLSAGATFTGEAIEVVDLAIIHVNASTDVASATDGLKLQLSTNGTDWDLGDVYSMSAGDSETYAIQPSARYFRVIYVNGASDQTTFRMQTILKKVYTLPSSHRVQEDIENEDDAQLVKAVLSQQHYGGVFKNVDTQHPIAIDVGSIFSKDVDLDESNNYGFSGIVTDYFDELNSVSVDTSATNPKQVLIMFQRTMYASAIGLGCDNLAYDFSNVKIKLLGSGQIVRSTIDKSTDSTKYNSQLYSFAPDAFNGILIEFHTADTVGLSNITVRKETTVSARISAITDDGTLANIGASDTGNLRITDAENGLAIAKEEVPGSSALHKFGNASGINTADGLVVIWDGLTAPAHLTTYTFSTTADIDSISSSSIADTQPIEIQGLDTNWEGVTQTITLTGQTRVALTTPLIRVYRMLNVGTTDLAGRVYCYVNGTISGGVPTVTNTIRAIINSGDNQTLMAVQPVPAGKTGYMRSWYASISNKVAAVSSVQIKARPFGQVFQTKHISSVNSAGSGRIQHVYIEPQAFTEKTDIIMRADTSANGVGVAAGFDMVLVDN